MGERMARGGAGRRLPVGGPRVGDVTWRERMPLEMDSDGPYIIKGDWDALDDEDGSRADLGRRKTHNYRRNAWVESLDWEHAEGPLQNPFVAFFFPRNASKC